MKTTFFKISAFALLFALMGASCEKNEQFEEIDLKNTKCPCEHEASFIKEITLENVLLFSTTKTTFEKMKEISFNGERSLFICYTPDTGSSTVYSIRTTMMGVSYICNFPDKAKEWEIPSNGIYISYTANEFELCEPKSSIANDTYSNLVLSSLKKQIK